MPEIRHNIITRDWVIVSSERAKRPEDLAKDASRPPSTATYVPNCPFCPGNEQMTPPEVHRIAHNGRWQIRVVPNKFPALDAAGELSRSRAGLKRVISGVGIHEVIVETPDHSKTLAALSQTEFEQVLATYHQRYSMVTADPRVAHATLFKNHGERAGTSLEHSHSQIVGTPIIPPQVRDRMETALRFYDEMGECILCSLLEDELRDGQRIVAQSDGFVAFLPYAALSPFHTWVFPRRHTASFIEATDAELADLSRLLRLVLRKIFFGLSNPDYNISVRTPPREARGQRYYHWYVSLIPRVTRIAGFEMGSGMFINISPPERSAEFLRSAPADPA